MACGRYRWPSSRTPGSTFTQRLLSSSWGDVPGCDEGPPDYTEADDETIAAGFPQWKSTFEPVHAVFLDSFR
jgi:hypothetical protein